MRVPYVNGAGLRLAIKSTQDDGFTTLALQNLHWPADTLTAYSANQT